MSFASILPKEVSVCIFGFLSREDLCNAVICCRVWRDICNSEKIWYSLCAQRGWTVYAHGMLDLQTLICSDEIVHRGTNVSGTSPRFDKVLKSEAGLSPILHWRNIFIRAVHLHDNWARGKYNTLPTLRGHESRVSALDSNGNVLVSGSSDCVLIWDLETMDLKYKISSHRDGINSIQLTGLNAVIACADGAVRVFNTISGRPVYSFQARCAAEYLKITMNDLIICTYADKAVRVWSIKGKILMHTMKGHSDEIECVAVRDELCITGSWDNKIILWDVVKGSMIYALLGHTDAIMCCEFDGDNIISASADTTVRVWNMHTAECIQCLNGDTDELYCLATNNKVIAAAGSGSTIALWSKTDYSLLYQLKQHLGVVRSLKFNGVYLISGGDRKMIVIWDSRTGAMLNIVHRNPDILHKMWVNETKIITASPNSPGSMTVLSYW